MSHDQNNESEHMENDQDWSYGNVTFVAQQLEFTLKELRETLRDRRTIITLVLMPLLLYPLLGFGLRYLAFQQADETETSFTIVVESESELNWLNQALQAGRLQLDPSFLPDTEADIQVLLPNDEGEEFDLQRMLIESAADLGIDIEFSPSDMNEFPPIAKVQLYEVENSSRSQEAAIYFERRLAAANIQWVKNWTQQLGQDFTVPIQQARSEVQPLERASAILGLLPLVLLLMTVTGGVYPAIDLTAGERERNTMETLMALPVSRFRLLSAKYVAVVTVTMMTGLMNLLAMGATLYALQLDKSLLGEAGFTIALAAKLFLALAAFALFYSAVLLLLTSSARSFKEAQAYLIPLLLLSIVPGFVIFLPGWKLASGSAAIPLINILLLSRDLLEGSVQQLPAIVAIVSTVLYGVAALSMAASVFGNDAVAIGSRGRWSDLFQRPKVHSIFPSMPTVLTTLALLFPLYFVVSSALARGESEPTERIAQSAVMTIALFVLVPLGVLSWQKVDRLRGLGLLKAAWLYWLPAILLGVATWPWIFEIVVYAHSWGIQGFDAAKIKNIEDILASWQQVPLWVIVLCLGVVPGVCEEIFFRGFLFNGLKRQFNPIATILVSAVLFGIFHVVLSGGAAPERVLPSTLMGVLLGWLTFQSGSVIPAIILHALHNSTLLIIVHSKGLLAEWNIGQLEQNHLPTLWLAISAALLVFAVFLTRWFMKHDPNLEPEDKLSKP